MKTNLSTSAKLFAIICCLLFLNSVNSNAQYYAWANNVPFVSRGNFGTFVGTDFHGNGLFVGNSRSCMSCIDNYVSAYNVNGLELWNIAVSGASSSPPPAIMSVATDYNNNRYILFANSLGDTHTFGSFSTNYSRFIVKFNPNGTPVRLTNLNDPYFKIVADSSGNMFIASTSKIRRYTRSGAIAWTKTNFVVTDIHVDRYRNCYVSNASGFSKFAPVGNLVYSKNVGGLVQVDPDGRVFVQNQTGLRKYSKTGVQQWLRPAIQDPFQINEIGNIYEFTADSIRKYNTSANLMEWTFEKLANGIVNKDGEIYIGGDYDMMNDDIQPCPFRMQMQPVMNQTDPNQVWIGLISGSAPIPFQAGVYTNQIMGPNYAICSAQLLANFASTSLFTYCTNNVSSFDPANTFTVQLSDITGSFNNPLDLGPPATAVIPDTITYGEDYRVRVVASTPGVTVHPNLPDGIDFGISVIPNPGLLSVSGPVSICEGQSFNISVSPSAYTGAIAWFNDGVQLNVPLLTSNVALDSSGSYYAILANGVCFRVSDTLNLTVIPSPNPVITPSGPLFICAGDSVQLTVNDADLSIIRWRRNGITVTGAIDTTFYASLAGTYTSRVFNTAGCATASAPVDVIVNCRQGELRTSNAIDMYPNPVSDVLYLEGLSDFEGTTTINLFDYSGRLVYENNAKIDDGGQLEMNLNQMPAGIYMIKLNNGDASYGKMIVKE